MKDWLARIDHKSWHYKLVLEFSRVPTKACTYYWVCVPKALLLGAFIYALYLIVLSVGWICGFTGDTKNVLPAKKLFFPYKTKPNGERKLVAPWEVIVGLLVTAGVARAMMWAPAHLHLIAQLTVGTVAVLVVILAAFFFSRYLMRTLGTVTEDDENIVTIRKPKKYRMRKLWNRICPDLVIK